MITAAYYLHAGDRRGVRGGGGHPVYDVGGRRAETVDCITDHRKGFIERDEEDIIIGPVANDQTFQTIGLYFRGFITAEMALQLLLPQNLKDQYCIKTEKALACLVFKEVKRI